MKTFSWSFRLQAQSFETLLMKSVCFACTINMPMAPFLQTTENQWLVPSRLRPETNNWKQPFSSSVSQLVWPASLWPAGQRYQTNHLFPGDCSEPQKQPLVQLNFSFNNIHRCWFLTEIEIQQQGSNSLEFGHICGWLNGVSQRLLLKLLMEGQGHGAISGGNEEILR